MLLDGEAQALTRKAVELALEGDTTALRLCLERLMPPRRDRATPLSIPPVRGAGDLMPAMAVIMAAAARGKISPGEGMGLAKFLDIFLNAIEVRDFDARLGYWKTATRRSDAQGIARRRASGPAVLR